jgi:glycosyltransferase involved in cell wall biosynthesis
MNYFKKISVAKKTLNIKENYYRNILVSVLVATYKQEKYILECLNSIKNQNYKNIEIIISDDNSKDGTCKIIKKFIKKNKNSKIKFFKQKKNLGINKNFNFLFNNAKGKYIIFFGGDDFMHKQKIEIQLKALEKNPDASFCYSNCGWYNDKMNIKYFNHFNLLQRPPKIIQNILSDYTIPSPTIMIRTKFLPKKPFNESLNHFSDFILTVNLFKKSNPVYINKVLVKYRRHSNSIMQSKTGNEDRLKLIKILKNIFKNDKISINKINLYKFVYLHNKIYDKFKLNEFPIKLIFSSFLLSFKSPKWFMRNAILLINCLRFLIGKKIVVI